MKFAVALALLASLASTTAIAGSCTPPRSAACTAQPAIDLSLAPDLSRQIISDDPRAQDAKKPSFDPAASAPYTGPSLGVVPKGMGATIGYHWSTD